LLLGRPKTYHPDTLLPILKPIWFAALQPCGLRLRALLPEWLPIDKADHHHLVRYLGQRPRPVLLTRARPYRKNDNAHVEQRNWTRVREHFGYERYDNPEVTPRINALCGARSIALRTERGALLRHLACEPSRGAMLRAPKRFAASSQRPLPGSP
jgi:hypothetical protein